MERRYFTENGKTFIECKSYYHTDIFEVVDKFPQGYVLWRVPYDMPDFDDLKPIEEYQHNETVTPQFIQECFMQLSADFGVVNKNNI